MGACQKSFLATNPFQLNVLGGPKTEFSATQKVTQVTSAAIPTVPECADFSAIAREKDRKTWPCSHQYAGPAPPLCQPDSSFHQDRN